MANAGSDAREQEFESVGTSPHRSDAKSKAMGRALFIDDMHFRGMLYGKVLRSKYSHARILRID
ncbi:MAG: hypothetical protein WCK00_17190, partial [Deltaproteobacteria bacterium]